MQFVTRGAEVAPTAVPVTRKLSALAVRIPLVMLAFALAVALVAVEGPATAEAATTTEAGRITNEARSHLGKPYRYGAVGLRRFDCSGFVYRTFYERGLLNRIGGSRKTARGYYDWFRSRGLANRRNPQKGDLIVWGNAKHIGIYVGDGLAVSALTTGVSRHAINRINISFTAYLHVRLSR